MLGGLITYQSFYLLWDPTKNTVTDLQNVAVVIAHELAHQWFGNLVTAAWWSNLWLNEGFATFVEYIGSDASNPELQMADQFITSAQREALNFDSGRGSHPIITDYQPNGAFDSISYAKGGSVIRMMEGLLTRPVFLAGIKAYLLGKSYSNAFSTDLFAYLDDASAKYNKPAYNVTEFMYEWTTRAGYPLVNCSTTPSQSSGDTMWTCVQSRFFTYSPAPADSTLWQIPVTAAWSGGSNSVSLWSQLNSTFTLTQPSTVAWAKLNANSTGFYRVLYSPYTYYQLSAALNQPDFGGMYHDDRLGLISDMYVFAQQGILRYPQVLNFSVFLQHDRAFTVWQVAHPQLTSLYQLIRYTEVGPTMADYMRQALSTAAGSINIRNNSAAADQILENVIGSSMIRFNAAGKRDQLRAVFEQLYDGSIQLGDVNPNLITLVLEAGVAQGTAADWQWVYEEFWLPKLNVNRTDPLPALRTYTILQTILAAPLTPPVIRQVFRVLADSSSTRLFPSANDAYTVLVSTVNNDVGLPVFNSWIQSPGAFAALNNTFTPRLMQSLIYDTLSLNVNATVIQQLSAFYMQQAPQLSYDITAVLSDARQAAQRTIDWLTLYYQPIAEYLRSRQWQRRSSE